jgi:hypothetical protein
MSDVALRRYTRLSFGVSSAAEIFQKTLSNALEGLDGIRSISNDSIVFGRNQEEPDVRLSISNEYLVWLAYVAIQSGWSSLV